LDVLAAAVQQELDISFNQVTRLGADTLGMKRLLVLNADGNPLSAESHAILKRMKRVELRSGEQTNATDPEVDDILDMFQRRIAASARRRARDGCCSDTQASRQPVLSVAS
jgi:hypothetical protein